MQSKRRNSTINRYTETKIPDVHNPQNALPVQNTSEHNDALADIMKKIKNIENPETESHTINFKTTNYKNLKKAAQKANISISKMLNYILDEVFKN